MDGKESGRTECRQRARPAERESHWRKREARGKRGSLRQLSCSSRAVIHVQNCKLTKSGVERNGRLFYCLTSLLAGIGSGLGRHASRVLLRLALDLPGTEEEQ